MSLASVLNATLLAAQDSQTRKPLIRIMSKTEGSLGASTGAIPFIGNPLDPSALAENSPAVIQHSSGAICFASILGVGAETNYIRYGYTDTARTQFTFQDYPLGTYQNAGLVALCELADGNIGIVWSQTIASIPGAAFLSVAGPVLIKYMTIAQTGGAILTSGTVLSQSSTAFFTGPCVITLASGTYLLVYGVVSGGNYALYGITSTDFATWSVPSQLSISGLTATNQISNPYLVQTSDGLLWLFFDYVTSISTSGQLLKNIYYCTSTNNGSTWSAVVQLTDYTTYAIIAQYPRVAEKTGNNLYVCFTQVMGSLSMDYMTAGFNTSPGYSGHGSAVLDIHFDSANRKLYVTAGQNGAGEKLLSCVCKVNVDTWEIDASWSPATAPPFPSLFLTYSTGSGRMHGEGPFVPIGTVNSGGPLTISLLNGQENTITNYNFVDDPAYSITRNVGWTPLGGYPNGPHGFVYMTLVSAWVDAVSQRMYVTFAYQESAIGCFLQIGWIDLTQTIDSSDPSAMYTWNQIIAETNQVVYANALYSLSTGSGAVVIDTAQSLILVSMAGEVSYWQGELRVYDLTSGGLIKDYTTASDPSFPYNGLTYLLSTNGMIYGSFPYQSLYGEEDKRGLCIIDTATGIITFSEPSWASVNDFMLRGMLLLPDGTIAIAAFGYGVTIFDPVALTWTPLIDNATDPGLTPGATNNFLNLAYDSVNSMFFAGVGVNPGDGSWCGWVEFSRYGMLHQPQYMIATYGTSWSFGSYSPLVQGVVDYDAALMVDPNNDLWCFWTHKPSTLPQTYWAMEMADLDLTSYLLAGFDITCEKEIDGTPNTLSFALASGHLFDPNNTNSLLPIYLQRGRAITLEYVEEVAGVDYYQAWGTFFVTEFKMTYQFNTYPSASVTCQDKRVTWADDTILATAAYEATDPGEVILQVLEDNANLTADQINVPEFTNTVPLTHQWIETALLDIINQIATRFGYFIRLDVNDILTARPISGTNAIDHIYADLSKFVSFLTPDVNSGHEISFMPLPAWRRTAFHMPQGIDGQAVSGAAADCRKPRCIR